MRDHIGAVRSLLAGETIPVEGRLARMLHWKGQAPSRPIEVPWVVAVGGPKGKSLADELGCGVFVTRPAPGQRYEGHPTVTMLAFGTVLDAGETADSPRVLTAAGPGVSVYYHALLESGDTTVGGLPNGDRFVSLVNAAPEGERHLHIHEGHLTELNPIDREVLVPDVLPMATIFGTADAVRERIRDDEAAGVTEIAFQPMGDIERELRAFAAAAGLG
jgi:5,10-methylenetetrahydromethanopterin reductase